MADNLLITHESSEQPVRGVAVLTETGYQVSEGKGGFINRNSVVFAIGRSISAIGDGFYLTMLYIWFVHIYTANAKTPQEQAIAAATVTAISSGTLASQYLAQMIVAPFMGVFIDRWNRRTTMIVSDLSQVFLSILPLFAFLTSQSLFIPTIYITYFLMNAAASLFTGSQNGVLQVIVSRKSLPQAVSALNIISFAGGIVAALVVGNFFLAVGPVIAVLFNSFSFLVSALSLILMRIPREAIFPYAYRPANETTPSAGQALLKILKDLWFGLRFVFSNRVLLTIMVMLAISSISFGAFNATSIGFAIANLHVDAQKDLGLIGVFLACSAAGSVLGALATGGLAKYFPVKNIMLVSIFVWGAGYAATAFDNTVLLGLISFFVVSAVYAVFTVSYTALMLKVTPNDIIGRTGAVQAPLGAVMNFVSALVVGGLATMFNPTINHHSPFTDFSKFFIILLLACGAIIIAAGIVGVLMLRGTSEDAPVSEPTENAAPVDVAVTVK